MSKTCKLFKRANKKPEAIAVCFSKLSKGGKTESLSQQSKRSLRIKSIRLAYSEGVKRTSEKTIAEVGRFDPYVQFPAGNYLFSDSLFA